MDQIIENPDSQNQEAEVEQPLEELALPESVEAVDAIEKGKLVEQNKKLYARLKKAEERAKAVPKEEKPVAPKVEATDDTDTLLTLMSEGKTPSEIKTLREYSRKMNKPISEVANDPVLKAGLEALRQKAQTEAAIPSPSKRSATFKGKTLQEVIATGSPAEAQAAIEQLAASRLGPKPNN